MGYNKEKKESPVPNLNKGYGHESVKTERHDLLDDNPVARDASGDRPWISKHFKSTMGASPLKKKAVEKEAKKPDFIDADGDGDTQEPMVDAVADAK
jgi:hypothetical protein